MVKLTNVVLGACVSAVSIPDNLKLAVALPDDLFSLNRAASSDASTKVKLDTFNNMLRDHGLNLSPAFPQIEGIRQNLARGLKPEGLAANGKVVNAVMRNRLNRYYIVDKSKSDITDKELLVLLNQDDLVESVSVESVITSPSHDEEPVKITRDDGEVEDFALCKEFPCQGYLHGSKGLPSEYVLPGNNVVDAWNLTGVKGEGVKVVIAAVGLVSQEPHGEFGPALHSIIDVENGSDLDSGKTAVSGIILSRDDNKGTTGIAPNVDGYIDMSVQVSQFEELFTLLEAGDVFNGPYFTRATPEAIEILAGEDPDCAEYECGFPTPVGDKVLNAAYSAIVDLGVAVFMCAGNGNVNFSASFWKGASEAVGEQKVTLVSSVDPLTGNAKANSNYSMTGTEDWDVDFVNWGSNVLTTAYSADPELNAPYTALFNGCSAATSITAGVGALIQSNAKALLGRPLEVTELVDLMKKTGHTVTTSGEFAHKNFKNAPMPDASAAVRVLKDMADNGGVAPDAATPMAHWVKAGLAAFMVAIMMVI